MNPQDLRGSAGAIDPAPGLLENLLNVFPVYLGQGRGTPLAGKRDGNPFLFI